MVHQVTLVADLEASVPGSLDYGVRPVAVSELDALGLLYFESYDPGVACDTVEEAVDDIQASFDGEYGALLPTASLVAVDEGALIGAVMTVHRPPWEGLPDCPMIIELFVDREHRQQGIGRYLIKRSMYALHSTDERQVSLRIDPTNEPATRLYASLGFRGWP